MIIIQLVVVGLVLFEQPPCSTLDDLPEPANRTHPRPRCRACDRAQLEELVVGAVRAAARRVHQHRKTVDADDAALGVEAVLLAQPAVLCLGFESGLGPATVDDKSTAGAWDCREEEATTNGRPCIDPGPKSTPDRPRIGPVLGAERPRVKPEPPRNLRLTPCWARQYPRSKRNHPGTTLNLPWTHPAPTPTQQRSTPESPWNRPCVDPISRCTHRRLTPLRACAATEHPVLTPGVAPPVTRGMGSTPSVAHCPRKSAYPQGAVSRPVLRCCHFGPNTCESTLSGNRPQYAVVQIARPTPRRYTVGRLPPQRIAPAESSARRRFRPAGHMAVPLARHARCHQICRWLLAAWLSLARVCLLQMYGP